MFLFHLECFMLLEPLFLTAVIGDGCQIWRRGASLVLFILLLLLLFITTLDEEGLLGKNFELNLILGHLCHLFGLLAGHILEHLVHLELHSVRDHQLPFIILFRWYRWQLCCFEEVFRLDELHLDLHLGLLSQSHHFLFTLPYLNLFDHMGDTLRIFVIVLDQLRRRVYIRLVKGVHSALMFGQGSAMSLADREEIEAGTRTHRVIEAI